MKKEDIEKNKKVTTDFVQTHVVLFSDMSSNSAIRALQALDKLISEIKAE